MVVAEEHGALLDQELRRREIDPDRLSDSGQLTRFDAATCLAQIVDADRADLDRLDRLMRPVVTSARARFGRVRGFGHMVDLLWQRGDFAAALAIEGYWNELLREVHCPLLCAYAISPTAPDLDAARARIADHHAATSLLDPAAA